jgi:hypothetical protein
MRLQQIITLATGPAVILACGWFWFVGVPAWARWLVQGWG